MALSGDRTRCRKLKEDKQTADIIARMFLEVDGEEEQEEHGFVTDDDIFLPKLFCQIGDRANGWNYKNIREATELYLSVLGGGKGGRLSLGDKTKPRPAWFDKNVWLKFKSVATASMEENIDIIKEIFRYYNLNPKVHCIFPLEEEEQVEEDMFGDVGEEIVGEGEGEEVLEEGEAQFEELLAMVAEGTTVEEEEEDDEVDQMRLGEVEDVFGNMEDRKERSAGRVEAKEDFQDEDTPPDFYLDGEDFESDPDQTMKENVIENVKETVVEDYESEPRETATVTETVSGPPCPLGPPGPQKNQKRVEGANANESMETNTDKLPDPEIVSETGLKRKKRFNMFERHVENKEKAKTTKTTDLINENITEEKDKSQSKQTTKVKKVIRKKIIN